MTETCPYCKVKMEGTQISETEWAYKCPCCDYEFEEEGYF